MTFKFQYFLRHNFRIFVLMNMPDILIFCTSAKSLQFGTRFNSKVTPFTQIHFLVSWENFLKSILNIYIFEMLTISAT